MFHNKAHTYFGQLLHEWVICQSLADLNIERYKLLTSLQVFLSYSGFGSSPFHETMILINLSYKVKSDGNRNYLILEMFAQYISKCILIQRIF